jgi:hypothetical protein
VKKYFDLKSDSYPGSQLYVYINISLLEDLPANNLTSRLTNKIRQTMVNATPEKKE